MAKAGWSEAGNPRMEVSQMALGWLWFSRAEIWSVGNGQQSSVETPQSVTSPSPLGSDTWAFFSSRLRRIFVTYSSSLSRVFRLLLPTAAVL